METYESIYDFIRQQETAYKLPIPVNEVWRWSMAKHILTTVLYSNSQLLSGYDEFKPVKNITRPILNLQHRTEEIEVKDIQIYIDDPDNYHLSFLVKKYHDDVFAVENGLDTFFDELNVSRIDFGGGLSKQLNRPCPEVVPLQSIAFCDQTDLLSGPLGLKHFYSPDQLLDMESKGWGNPSNGATASLQDVINLSRDEKQQEKNTETAKTPGRYIEIYEVHGNLPKSFANPSDDSGQYETRIFICCFYQKKGAAEKQGIILYTAPEPESPFKIILRDPIYGRALGFGGAEELFEAQVWTNYDMIRKQQILDAASKTFLKSTDPTVSQKNNIREMENLEIIDIAPNTDISQVDTQPRNMQLFIQSLNEWEVHAKEMGAAQDPLQGNEPTSGTPFASLQTQIQQGMGLHQYRRGQFANHLEEIYRDWIIPNIQKKICEGTKFLSELSVDELAMVAEGIANNTANQRIKEMLLAGAVPSSDEMEQLKQTVQDQFKKRGNKHFIEILKGEFKGKDLKVKVNIAGKQKDLSGMVDKLTNVFKTILANPYMLQSPPIVKLFNQIIEASGLDPIDLSGFNVPPSPQRRMMETIAYKDLIGPPTPAQAEMLKLAGIDMAGIAQDPNAQPQQQQPNQPPR